MYHGNLAAIWMQRTAGKQTRVYWNIRHSLSDLSKEKWLTRQVIRAGAALSRRPDRILYNSDLSARQHEQQGYDSARSIVIPNGFDTTRFRPMQEKSGHVYSN